MTTGALSCSAVPLCRRASEQQPQQQDTEAGPAAWWASMFVKAGRMGNAQRDSKQPKIRVHGFSEQDQTALYMQVGRAVLLLWCSTNCHKAIGCGPVICVRCDTARSSALAVAPSACMSCGSLLHVSLLLA